MQQVELESSGSHLLDHSSAYLRYVNWIVGYFPPEPYRVVRDHCGRNTKPVRATHVCFSLLPLVQGWAPTLDIPSDLRRDTGLVIRRYFSSTKIL